MRRGVQDGSVLDDARQGGRGERGLGLHDERRLRDADLPVDELDPRGERGGGGSCRSCCRRRRRCSSSRCCSFCCCSAC